MKILFYLVRGFVSLVRHMEKKEYNHLFYPWKLLADG